jgi:hypothetical protein
MKKRAAGRFVSQLAGVLVVEGKCFCSYGALVKVVGWGDFLNVLELIMDAAVAEYCAHKKKYRNSLASRELVTFNDHYDTTHADVMAVFAIGMTLALEV